MPKTLFKNKKLSHLTHQILTWGTTILAFLLPLYFLPLTVEFYEFNKQILLVGFTVILAIACALKMFADGKVRIAKNPLNLPLGIFLAVAILSTIFSANKYLSFMGNYGYFHGNILEATSLIILFFIITTSLAEKEIKKVKYALIASGVAASLLWFLFVFKLIPYIPLGSTSALAIFAALIFTLSLHHIIAEEKWYFKPPFLVSALLCLLAVILASSLTGWVVLGAGLAGFLATAGQQTLRKNAKILIFLGMLGVFVVAVNFTPGIKEDFGIDLEPSKEIQLDYRTSWAVAAGSFRDYPLIGSGPGTFTLDFTRYKPLSFNAASLWTFSFDRARSEYLQIMTELGMVGILVYFFVIWTYLKMVVKSENKNPWLILPGLLFLTQFFTHTATSLSFVLFLSLALAVAELKDKRVEVINEDILPATFLILSLMLLPLIYFGGRVLAADIYEKQGIAASQKGEGAAAYNSFFKAVEFNPWQDIYHNNYALINLQLAQALSQREDLNDEDRAQVTRLLQQAIREVRISTEQLNPLSARNWQVRALFYRNLAGVEGTERWALNAYNQAISLDPLNPLLRFGLGEVYYSTEDWNSSILAFAAAAQLKSDYANARYNLAYALKETKRFPEAKTELETVLRLVEPNSADYYKVKDELDELVAQIGKKEEELEELSVSALEAPSSAELEEETTERLPLTEPGSVLEASPSAVTHPNFTVE